MVPRRLERIGKPLEETLPVVTDQRRLAVHRRRRPDDAAAEDLPDRLVTETDAEDRKSARHPADQVLRDPRGLRTAGTGRYDYGLEAGALHVGDGHGIVAADFHLGSQLPQILDEVVGERVVVVEDEDHDAASPTAASSASALRHVSSYSRAGEESATIPAPAWTKARPFR